MCTAKLPVTFVVAVLLMPGCDGASDPCGDADALVRRGDYQSAVARADACLAVPHLDHQSKALAYRARALANFNLANYDEAAADQIKVVSLTGVGDEDMINCVLFLRMAGRTTESLEFALKAEHRDETTRHVSMMTQYQLGWSYAELGEYQNAVEAFTKGIPAQPDYAFVYWQRGLAFHHLHRSKEAKQDFERFIELVKAQNFASVPRSKLPEVGEILAMYDLRDPFADAAQ